MSVFVASLNSGSNGNCYYIGCGDDAVLIDGGISRRETEKRLKRLGLSIKKIRAVFITHEHGDHIHGVPSLAKKYKLPVYITRETYRNAPAGIPEDTVRYFQSFDEIAVGSLNVMALPKRHDAIDPHSFVVRNSSVSVGVFTDIGIACDHVKKYFSQCHAAFLESNYDAELLERGRYPIYLKNRIRGGRGHLSNIQALELFRQHRSPFMTHLFLSHLSKDNNRPTLVRNLFERVAGNTQIVVASRERESRLYHIRNLSSVRRMTPSRTATGCQQLALF